MGQYNPGYVEVPGKGRKYRNAKGEYFDNHFGSIGSSFSDAMKGLNQGYTNYYDGVADRVGTERRDGTIKTPTIPTGTKQETPTQNATRPVQSTGGGVINAFGESFNMGVPAEKSAYEAAQAAELTRQRTSSPFSDLRGGDGNRSGGKRNSDPRKVTVTNPNGVVQTGTQTGISPMTMDDANSLLTGGYTMNQKYASNQLPTTASSPYQGKGNAQIYNPDTLHQHDSDVDYVSLSKNLDEDKSGVETYQRGKNMKADYEQMDVNPGQQVPEEKINWANRTMADNSDEKLARRRAFLDAKGSMQGLRRTEALQNMSYAGGQHYIGDGKGGKNLIAVTERDDVYKYKEGPEGASQIRDKYVNALTSKEESPELLPDSETAASTVETSPNQKPLTVAPSDIPSDLSGAAGQEYLKKLDAGLLTRNR